MARTVPTDASTIGASSTPVLLTVDEAARMLSLSRSKTYQLVAARELDVVHIGRSLRVPMDAVHELVARLRSGGPSSADPWAGESC